MVLPKGIYRADHVGSWLRSQVVLEARQQFADGKINAVQLRKVEDETIQDVVAKQMDVGIRSITDGEFRRAYFHLDFLKQLDGVTVTTQLASPGVAKNGFSPPVLMVEGKLRHSKPIQVADFQHLHTCISKKEESSVSRPRAVAKVSIPSPTMLHFRGGRASIDLETYPDLDVFFDDLAAAYRAELDSLYEAGCRLIQLDDTNLAYLCDPAMREQAEKERKMDLTTLPRRYAAVINAAITPRPADLTIGIHLCRGNYQSQWFASGGYEPVAEILLRELNVDAYFLEYDDARSGDFAPLRFLPEDKTVVLGLLSSKTKEVADRTEIVRRLHEAAKFCPRGLDQLCLSHQCGFSSTVEGNQLSEEEQWAKVKQEVEIAKSVWGDDLSV